MAPCLLNCRSGCEALRWRKWLSRSLALWVALAMGCGALAAETLTWKPVTAAVLKIDQRPAKGWNVYQAEKKHHLILVQLGRRFLLLDIKAHEVYELAPESLEQKGNELRWKNAEIPTAATQRKQTEPATPGSGTDAAENGRAEKPLPSADWVVRDVGHALLVRVRLTAEGRVLEVQLPRPRDLRSLY